MILAMSVDFPIYPLWIGRRKSNLAWKDKKKENIGPDGIWTRESSVVVELRDRRLATWPPSHSPTTSRQREYLKATIAVVMATALSTYETDALPLGHRALYPFNWEN